MLGNPVTLRTNTLVTLVRRTGNEPHTTLNKGATWYSPGAQRELDGRIAKELAGIGLADGGEIDPRLLATVAAIARPDLEYFGWAGGPHEDRQFNTAVLAGSGRGEAFVIARDVDRGFSVLATVSADALLDNFLTQLPPQRPASGQQVVIPKSVANGDKRSADEDFHVMRSHTPDANQRAAAEYQRILGLGRVGGGKLYVAARGRGGTRRRCEKPVTYLDTVEGRWLLEEVPGTGEPQYVVTPGTSRLIGDRLRYLRSQLPTS